MRGWFGPVAAHRRSGAIPPARCRIQAQLTWLLDCSASDVQAAHSELHASLRGSVGHGLLGVVWPMDDLVTCHRAPITGLLPRRCDNDPPVVAQPPVPRSPPLPQPLRIHSPVKIKYHIVYLVAHFVGMPIVNLLFVYLHSELRQLCALFTDGGQACVL